jgi:hypothetical protein
MLPCSDGVVGDFIVNQDDDDIIVVAPAPVSVFVRRGDNGGVAKAALLATIAVGCDAVSLGRVSIDRIVVAVLVVIVVREWLLVAWEVDVVVFPTMGLDREYNVDCVSLREGEKDRCPRHESSISSSPASFDIDSMLAKSRLLEFCNWRDSGCCCCGGGGHECGCWESMIVAVAGLEPLLSGGEEVIWEVF